MGTQVYDEQFPLLVSATINDGNSIGDWASLIPDVLTAHRLDSVYAYSTDTVDLTVTLGWYYLTQLSSTAWEMGSAVIPAGSGNGTVALAELLTLAFGATFPGLSFQAGYGLAIRVDEVPATGKMVRFVGFGASL